MVAGVITEELLNLTEGLIEAVHAAQLPAGEAGGRA